MPDEEVPPAVPPPEPGSFEWIAAQLVANPGKWADVTPEHATHAQLNKLADKWRRARRIRPNGGGKFEARRGTRDGRESVMARYVSPPQ